MSRKTVILCLLSLIILVSLTTSVLAEVKGPIVDKVYINVRMSEDIGLKDAAEGLTDIFFWGVNGPTIMGLDQATRDKLDIYAVPSGSWSLNFNPVPNAAPYIVKVEDKEFFNPFAIREVRFAMNDLIDRKYLVDEILGGAGGPMFTMGTPGQPGTYKYNLVANRLGFTPEGNEKKAIEDITEALQTAAALPELQGRLVKQGEWWTFDGEPVTINFLIRVDDPQGRLKEGEYVASQIEKAGIKVERCLWDRVKCIETSYYSDPADYQWNIYTEGWGAGATRAFWEHIVAQMYAPWYGYMAGGPDSKWHYENNEIDRLTEKAYTGNFLTEEEYWDTVLEALDLALKDACRIYVAYQMDYYAANKAAFNNRMCYGLGDGLNEWSLITANTKNKELRITEYSAKGALFMSAWDPIGTEGFNDVYSLVIAQPLSERGSFESPASAIATPWRTIPYDVKTEVDRDEAGEVVGKIPVLPEAIKYDSAKKEWYKVGSNETAMSKGTYNFIFGNFHHGRPMTIANILYADAFVTEWITKDGDDDRYYDAAYEDYHRPDWEISKGMTLNLDGTITNYFDYNFPPSKERVAANGAPQAYLSGRYMVLPWEIFEALAELVAVRSESGTVYSFTPGDGVEQVDLLRPSCVKDIRAKLVELKDNSHLPVSLKDYVTVEEAKAGYEAAIKWIDEKGHAFIGNGAFYLEKYDPTTNYIELTAFRDPEYPFTPDYWPSRFATTTVRVDSVDVPAMYLRAKKEDLSIKIQLSEVLYPDGTAKIAQGGEVSAMLITPTEELSYKAKFLGAGSFEAIIPADDIKDLEDGSYTILISASIEGAVPASVASSTVIY
ncbi:ABC transporter substrate-binding protein [bacterium]|nr:ABC transporter substrate-binding protein [bacterium]